MDPDLIVLKYKAHISYKHVTGVGASVLLGILSEAFFVRSGKDFPKLILNESEQSQGLGRIRILSTRGCCGSGSGKIMQILADSDMQHHFFLHAKKRTGGKI
jgi:hypothetical protein